MMLPGQDLLLASSSLRVSTLSSKSSHVTVMPAYVSERTVALRVEVTTSSSLLSRTAVNDTPSMELSSVLSLWIGLEVVNNTLVW